MYDKFKVIAKLGVSMVVSVGVGAIVGHAIKHVSPADMKMLTKICIGAGSLALTGVAREMAAKYAEQNVDLAFEAVDKVKELIQGESETIELF